MSPNLISLEQLVLALVAIDQHPRHGWATKARIVALIGRWPGGVHVGRDTIAWWLGARSRGHVSDLLAQLVDERVILTDPGSGRRATAYRVNPELLEWRKVPWRRDPRDVIASMFHGEQGPDDNNPLCGPVHAPDDKRGLFARYADRTASTPVVVRSTHRTTTVPPVVRSTHRTTTGPDAVRSTHRTTTGPAVGHSTDRTTTGDDALVVVPPPVDDDFSSSSSWGPEEEERELRKVVERDAACDAIRRRVGAHFFRGAPRLRADALVDAYGLQAVLDAVKAEPPGSAQLPAYVDRLAGRLASAAHGVDLDDLGPADEAPVEPGPAREVREYDRYEPDTDPGPSAEERARAGERAAAAREALAASLSGATIPVAEGGETP